MIVYGLLVKSEALGSTDGFNILPSTLFGVRPGPQWVRYAVLISAAAVSLMKKPSKSTSGLRNPLSKNFRMPSVS